MQGNNKFLFFVAAALASAGLLEENTADGKFGVQTAFSSTDADGMLRTSQDYAIRIDRLVIDSDTVDLSLDASQTPQASWVVAGTSEEEEIIVEEPSDAAVAFRLDGVFVEGRVFDLKEGSQRLPSNGVGISGTLPLGVKVKKEESSRSRQKHSNLAMAVELELPQALLDGIDWGVHNT